MVQPGDRCAVVDGSVSSHVDLSLDWVVLAYTAAVATATVAFFGTVPALRATRIEPIDALKAPGGNARLGGGRSLHSRFAHSGSSGLVIAQVAFSLVLMAAAGLFIRTFDHLANVPLGFDPERVLVISVDTAREARDPGTRYRTTTCSWPQFAACLVSRTWLRPCGHLWAVAGSCRMLREGQSTRNAS